jgi:hypothetical protein
MKVTGEFILKLSVELSDSITISYNNLLNFFYNEDYEFYEDIIEYRKEKILLDNNYEIPLKYLPIFEYLLSIGIVDKITKHYDERTVFVKNFDLFETEMEKIKELTKDMLNNYESYEREILIDSISN